MKELGLSDDPREMLESTVVTKKKAKIKTARKEVGLDRECLSQKASSNSPGRRGLSTVEEWEAVVSTDRIQEDLKKRGRT